MANLTTTPLLLTRQAPRSLYTSIPLFVKVGKPKEEMAVMWIELKITTDATTYTCRKHRQLSTLIRYNSFHIIPQFRSDDRKKCSSRQHQACQCSPTPGTSFPLCPYWGPTNGGAPTTDRKISTRNHPTPD